MYEPLASEAVVNEIDASAPGVRRNAMPRVDASAVDKTDVEQAASVIVKEPPAVTQTPHAGPHWHTVPMASSSPAAQATLPAKRADRAEVHAQPALPNAAAPTVEHVDDGTVVRSTRLTAAAPLPNIPAVTPVHHIEESMVQPPENRESRAPDDAPTLPGGHDERARSVTSLSRPASARSPLLISQQVAVRAMREPLERKEVNPEPVINVTIGRLEVRAQPQESAPRAQRSALRPTSLDEYLAKGRGRP